MSTNLVTKRDTISIKGTKNGLVILLDLNQDYTQIKEHLQMKMESSNGFFSGATYMFHTGQIKLTPYQQSELDLICINYGLAPCAQPNPYELEELFYTSSTRTKNKNTSPGEPALLIKRTLRSGQYISHPSHIVIIGNVHPGAKVEAGGNILVMGTCSGTVHAGIGGNHKTNITAFQLSPQLLRIADVIFSGTVPKNPDTGPYKALVLNNHIIIKY